MIPMPPAERVAAAAKALLDMRLLIKFWRRLRGHHPEIEIYHAQERAEAHQQELDWWDEEFRFRTGQYPTFSRLFPIFSGDAICEVGVEDRRRECASRPTGSSPSMRGCVA